MKPIRHTLVAAALLVAGGSSAQTLKISGSVKGFHDDVYVFANTGKGGAPDTLKNINGKFSGTIKVDKEPIRRTIMIGRYGFGTWIEPGELKIKGDTGNIKSFEITGTPTTNDAKAYYRLQDEGMAQLRKKYEKTAKDSSAESIAIRKAALSESSALQTKIKTDFIRNHPDSYFSMFLLSQIREDHNLETELFSRLSPRVRESAMAKTFRESMDISKRSATGEPVLQFTRNDLNGTPVSIASYKGKYVLVDFWASWCKPCRMENPNVLAAYNEYKDRNFTVLGVSIDDDTDKWKEAVKEDGMPWTHVRDRENRKSEILDYYGIKGIPSTLLVGPDGKILARNLRGEELHKKLAELIK